MVLCMLSFLPEACFSGVVCFNLRERRGRERETSDRGCNPQPWLVWTRSDQLRSPGGPECFILKSEVPHFPGTLTGQTSLTWQLKSPKGIYSLCRVNTTCVPPGQQSLLWLLSVRARPTNCTCAQRLSLKLALGSFPGVTSY